MNLFSLVLISLCSAVTFAQHAFEQYTDVWRGYQVIPRQLMTAEDLVSLGLEALAEESVPVKLSELGKSLETMATENTPIVVPKESSLMLLFNSSRPAAAGNTFTAAFSRSSLPLSLPQFYYVVDLFLLVPSSSFSATPLALGRSMPTADVWLHKFGLERDKIPLAGSMVEQGMPFVAFIFQSGDDLNDFGSSSPHESLNPPSKHKISDAMAIASNEATRAVIASSDGFFDNFARVFVNALGYDKLFQAIFCEVNTQATEMSYCVRKTDTDTEVSVIAHASIFNTENDVGSNGGADARLSKRLFWGSDDCDDDDDDDDEEGFDWLNPYDYDYLMRSSMAKKLKKMISLIEIGIEDDDDGSGDDDDDDDNDDAFNDATFPRFGGMDEFMETSPYFQRDEDSEDLSLNDRLQRLDRHEAGKDDKRPDDVTDDMPNKAPPPIFISTASVIADDKNKKSDRALKKLRKIRLRLERMEKEDAKESLADEIIETESMADTGRTMRIKKSTIPHLTFRGNVHISDYARNLYKKLNTFVTNSADHQDDLTNVDEETEDYSGPELDRLYGATEHRNLDDGSVQAELKVAESERDNIEMTDEEMSEYLAMLEKDDAEYINKARLFKDPNADVREAANPIKLKRSQSVLNRDNYMYPEKKGQLQRRQSLEKSMHDSHAKECIEVTWKGVFTHALFGEPANFCTTEQIKAQAKSQN